MADLLGQAQELGLVELLRAMDGETVGGAAKGMGKAGKIRIVSFDEQDPTLQGIIDGNIHGTVSQQPYYYGYESVRILAKLAAGDRSVLPAGGFFEVPIVEVRQANVQEFWKNLKKLQSGGA